MLKRRALLLEDAVGKCERLTLPTAHPGELVELVQLAPLCWNPMAVPEQAIFAIQPLVMCQSYDDSRQHGLPALLFAVVAGLESRLISIDERLHHVEGAVPEPCFHRARALIIGRILLCELADHGITAGINAQQRLGLIGADRAPAAGE